MTKKRILEELNRRLNVYKDPKVQSHNNPRQMDIVIGKIRAYSDLKEWIETNGTYKKKEAIVSKRVTKFLMWFSMAALLFHLMILMLFIIGTIRDGMYIHPKYWWTYGFFALFTFIMYTLYRREYKRIKRLEDDQKRG